MTKLNKKKGVDEDEDLEKEPEDVPRAATPPIDSPRPPITEKEELLALYQKLKDLGINSISDLEVKISRLAQFISLLIDPGKSLNCAGMFMPNEDVNPLKEDGTPKSPEEIAQERKDKGLPLQPGSQTDPALQLKSLQEEREKRKKDGETINTLTARITELETSLASSDVFSDEGKALQKQIDESKTLIETLTTESAKKDVLISHPILKEKWEEFETFRADPENKGMNLRTAAKAYLTENGLLDPVRLGLEKPTGGPRIPVSDKMSVDDIKTLRETNWPKYLDMVKKGLIKV